MEALKNSFDFSDFAPLDLMIAGGIVIFFLIFPFLSPSAFAISTMIQFFMFSLYGMGWNTIGGYGGQVDLGKAQYVGIGAYTTAVMLIRWDIPFWFSMPIGVCLAVAWSFIIGYPLFRLKGHYFAIATIATSLVLKDLFEVWEFVGAARGLEISPIKYTTPDFVRLIFKEDIYYYYVIFAFFIIGILYINSFRKSRLGFQLRSIKDNEDVARSLGVNVHLAKVKTYAIATAFVSVVGSFHACYIKNIEPEDTMSLDISILIALMAMLGGGRFSVGPHHRGRYSDSFEKLPQGVAWGHGRFGGDRPDYLRRHYHDHLGQGAPGNLGHCGTDPAQEAQLMTLLRVENLTKDYGGLRANDDISFSLDKDELLGLIGPNGAGKTTLFNCIAGLHPVTSGRIVFNGEDITSLGAYQVARRGLARTFQVYTASGDLNVLENVMVGCFMRTSSRARAKARAQQILSDLTLADMADYLVAELPVAAQKRVTLATALGTAPKLLLLDEVAAGLNPSEIEDMMVTINYLHNDLGVTIVLIEHVMELVMKVCDRIVVLDYGKKIAEGDPTRIAPEPAVIKAYLGERYAQEQAREME